MEQFNLSLLPTAIDVTLYKYNYIDNKIWTQIHNSIDYIERDEAVLISASQLKHLLDTNYISTIDRIKTIGSDVLYKEVNSVYFLYQMCIEMENLQYIRFNLNKDKSYDRLVEVEGDKMLQFSFKVMTATLRLFDLYNEDELVRVNKLLCEIGVLSPGSPYNRIFASELTEKINAFLAMHNEDDNTTGIILDIVDVLENKLESENSLILLITDY